MDKQEVWKMLIMDFLNNIQWGNVFTAVTLLTTIGLAFRDYSRTKAEAHAKNAEANKSETDAADKITESALKLLTPKDKQIEQQDLQITRLLAENQQISTKYTELSKKYEDVVTRLEKCEKCLKSLGGDCIND